MTYSALILRALLALLGCLFIYISLFLYEGEERKIQNLLEDWWIRIDDLRLHALSRQEAFIRVAADRASNALTLLFGEQLISFQAAIVSVFAGLTAVSLWWLVWCIYMTFTLSRVEFPLWAGSVNVLSGVAMVYVTSKATTRHLREPRIRWHWRFLRVVLGFTGFITLSAFWTWSALPVDSPKVASYLGSFGAYFLFLPGCYLGDLLFLAVARWALKVVGRSISIVRAWLVLLANLLLGLALLGFPILPWLSFIDAPPVRAVGGMVGMLVAVSNTPAALAALLFFLLAAALGVHRLLWPVAERPLYALARHSVFRKRRLLLVAGILLVLLAVPMPEAWENEIRTLLPG